MSQLPSYVDLQWSTVQVMRDMGGSGSIEEIDNGVIEADGLSEEQQSIPHKDSTRSEVRYRLAWARTLLKKMGLVENSSRGVWSLTGIGFEVSEEDSRILYQAARQGGDAASNMREKILQRHNRSADHAFAYPVKADVPRTQEEATILMLGDAGVTPSGEDAIDSLDWEERLLRVLLSMDPIAFERLSQRLLRESGFSNVVVTQRSRDGGIDGVGSFKISLLSFRVYFQCKRYQGQISSPTVRDFRGAMAGRGDKGIIFTTSSFTSEARKEASREGATSIELIDGSELCSLLKNLGMGVTVKERVVEDVEIHDDYFAAFEH
ncbi:UNVERIFIED_CONTAM: restriction endonuclease [Kocuria sp. CPCC 205316]|uniref:restriction endonuclease n=1 Tax=Kocuria TaxID=57493 RepID=UPI0036DD70DC